VASAVPGPVNLPLIGGSPSFPGTNPLNGDAGQGGVSDAGGAPGGAYNPNNAPEIAAETLARRIEPSAADQQFLRDHIVAYEQQLSLQERVKLEAKLTENLGIEGRLDGNQRFIRRVDLPQDGEPGRLSYSIEGGAAFSTKEKFELRHAFNDPATGKPGSNRAGITESNIRDIGDVNARLTLSWDVPADRFNGQGQPFPDADVLGSGGWQHPDSLSVRLNANGMAQSPLDVSRTDQVQLQLEAELSNPDRHAGQIFDGLLGGNVGEALAQVPADTTLTARAQFVARDGTQTQTDLGVDIGVEVKVGLIANVGNDDITHRFERTWTGAAPAAATEPAGTPGQLVITPLDGVSVRPTPGTDEPRVGVLQHGTFAQPTGQVATDAQGRDWVQVRSTDVNDEPIEGWVAQQYTAPHPQGAMDGTGRINLELEQAGYREVQVKQGDTVWDIARANGTDFQETVALNRDHLINPDMIFPGDTLYLPGPVNPPPAAPPVGATPPAGGSTPPGGSTPSVGSSPPGGISPPVGSSPPGGTTPAVGS
ncbi:MAG: LysM peptidoglycan-binding domain-containing protein, partial [Gemmatimonadaceae bacterium]|nr:LysM peptidoglycan-binding domain-containing protein [Acetobacteraceae bacterium]